MEKKTVKTSNWKRNFSAVALLFLVAIFGFQILGFSQIQNHIQLSEEERTKLKSEAQGAFGRAKTLFEKGDDHSLRESIRWFEKWRKTAQLLGDLTD